MLYTKFEGHQPAGFREKTSKGFLYGHGGHLGHMTRTV